MGRAADKGLRLGTFPSQVTRAGLKILDFAKDWIAIKHQYIILASRGKVLISDFYANLGDAFVPKTTGYMPYSNFISGPTMKRN